MAALLAGTVFFPLCNRLIFYSLKAVFGKKLSPEDYCLITEKCVSSLQALLSMICGAIIVNACQNNIMEDKHWLTNTYAFFAIPYFLYDLWAMYLVYYEKNCYSLKDMSTYAKIKTYLRSDVAMVMHHIGLAFVIYPMILTVRGSTGDFFIAVFYLCEMAVPFIAIRFILVQLKLKRSPLYVIAGLQMIFAFFVSRICSFPYAYWKYAQYAGISFWQVMDVIPLKCNVGCLFILVFQLYWMGLMIRGAFHAFCKLYTGPINKQKE